MRWPSAIFDGSAKRREAIEEAREAGKYGATRVPDTVLFGYGELSDTAILQMTAAFFEGRDQREKDRQS